MSTSNDDWSIRRDAVWKSEDQGLLINIAKNDEHWAVRKAAIEKLSDITILNLIESNDSDETVRTAAKIRISELSNFEKKQSDMKASEASKPEKQSVPSSNIKDEVQSQREYVISRLAKVYIWVVTTIEVDDELFTEILEYGTGKIRSEYSEFVHLAAEMVRENCPVQTSRLLTHDTKSAASVACSLLQSEGIAPKAGQMFPWFGNAKTSDGLSFDCGVMYFYWWGQ